MQKAKSSGVRRGNTIYINDGLRHAIMGVRYERALSSGSEENGD